MRSVPAPSPPGCPGQTPVTPALEQHRTSGAALLGRTVVGIISVVLKAQKAPATPPLCAPMPRATVVVAPDQLQPAADVDHGRRRRCRRRHSEAADHPASTNEHQFRRGDVARALGEVIVLRIVPAMLTISDQPVSHCSGNFRRDGLPISSQSRLRLPAWMVFDDFQERA